MSVLDKANWLVDQGVMDNMVFFMSDNEIEALYDCETAKRDSCDSEQRLSLYRA